MAKHERVSPEKAAKEVKKKRASETEYEQTDEKVEPRKKVKKSGGGNRTLLITLIVIAALCAGIVLCAYLVSNSEKNLPNVYVGKVDVSRLTKEQTKQKLLAEKWDEVSAKPLKLSFIGIMDVDIDPVESGCILTVDNAAEKAHEYGHSGNMFENLLTFVKSIFKETDINALNSERSDKYLDTKLMEGFDGLNELYGIDEFHEDVEGGKITTRKGWGQIDFDKNDIKDQIEKALHNGDKELNYTTLTKEVTMPDFKSVNEKYPKESKDAYYTEDGKFNVIDEVVAADFDVSEAERLWNEAQVGATVEIPLKVEKPAVLGEDLRNRLFHDLIGAMSTRYTNSADNRCSNVRLCASKINEFIVYPGEVFSYNQTVGKRTEEAGFKPAPAYVGLDSEETVKDEIGGGCCQVSSTLYAATLFAFLETVERSCHIYPVNYMQLGIDATVTIPEGGNEIDFKFKNNKNYPVKIVAYNNESDEEKKVTVEIWGTLEDDDYMPVEFDASYSWTQDYDRKIEPSYPDRPGYKIKLEHDTYTDAGERGTITSTQTWRRVYDSSGALVTEEITNLPHPGTGEPSMDQYNEHK